MSEKVLDAGGPAAACGEEHRMQRGHDDDHAALGGVAGKPGTRRKGGVVLRAAVQEVEDRVARRGAVVLDRKKDRDRCLSANSAALEPDRPGGAGLRGRFTRPARDQQEHDRDEPPARKSPHWGALYNRVIRTSGSSREVTEK